MARRDAETPPREVPLVRIFLSSPGDVAEERILARQFIDSELPKLPPFREKVKFELIAWDDPAARIPMLATETPQDSVNTARPRPANCDIVIVILWSRMGTPLPNSVRKPSGETYLSGTEWEYEDAVNSRPRPQVLVYRRTEKPKVELDDPNFDDKRAQFRYVEAFFARFRNPDGSLTGSVSEYTTPGDFKVLLRQNLEDILYQRLQPSGDKGEPPSSAAIIPPEYVEWLKRSCADVSLLGQDIREGRAITLDHVYVPMLTRPAAAPPAPKEGRRKQHEEAEQQQQRKEQKSVPLLARLDQESLYVPAPAGARKSTFCRWAVLQSIAGIDTTHPVPTPAEFAEPVPAVLRGRLSVLIPLRDFHQDWDCGRGRRVWHRGQLEQAMAAWLDASQLEGLTGSLLLAHLKAGSAFLLLDGLDEVPVSDSRNQETAYPRDLLVSGLADALPVWLKAGNRVLLTSRPYGPDEAGLHRLGLPRAPLDPLPKRLQELFVARWFHALDKEDQTGGLIATIRDRGDLAPLVENPMMLTALCVLYDSGGRLPDDRYELYKRIINTVLFHRFRDEAREREPARARLEAIALGMHTGDVDSPRLSPALEISYLDIDHILREFAADDSSYERGRVQPVAQREELLASSGLLLPRPNDRAAFYHLSVQEFLAAERILRTKDDLEPVFRERAAVAEWRPTLLFLFTGKIASKTPRWGLDLLAWLIADQDRARVKANPAPAVFIAEALDLCVTKNYAVPEALKEDFRHLALDAIEYEVALQARQTLGLCLGRLGDPRIPGLRDPSAYVEVPTGIYPYSTQAALAVISRVLPVAERASGGSRYVEDEGKTVEITAPFQIGRYPVTNGQYQAFIDDSGYRERRWWSEIGWTWLQREGVTEPAYWRDQRWNALNQPVVGVSFWEAEACCAWAGGRLPREEEWKAAARGREGYAYPWGNGWQDGICNTAEAGLGSTSPVGLFPRARQARLGIEDLTGNVWEWCGSIFDPSDTRGSDVSRVLRGGSWFNDQDYVSAFRGGSDSDARANYFGFRAVC